MTEQTILGTLGPLPVTAYGLILAAAAGAGLLWMHFTARRIGLPQDTAVRFGLWAVPLGLIGGRGLFVMVRWSLVVKELGWQQIFRLWDGGFALFGVISGCLLAAVLCARRMRVSVGDLLDAAAPGAALMLAISRFAEYFTLQGTGHPVENTAWQWFPAAMRNSYQDWVMPVFFWEGLAALGIAVVTVKALYNPKRKASDAALIWLLLLGATQVLLESLRTDDVLRWRLVKVSQLAAMACVLAVAIRWGVQAVRAGASGTKVAVHGAVLLAGVCVCVGVEFALDKSPISNVVLYGIMALVLAMLVTVTGRLRKLVK